jgi:hypothetical protein
VATKAELFRYHAERSGPKRPKASPKLPRNSLVDTALPGVSASVRKVGAGSTAARNVSRRAARSAPYRLEDSGTGRPSRKSTRRSANRLKNDRKSRAKRIAARGAP